MELGGPVELRSEEREVVSVEVRCGGEAQRCDGEEMGRCGVERWR